MRVFFGKNALLAWLAGILIAGSGNTQSVVADKRMNTQDITSKVVYHTHANGNPTRLCLHQTLINTYHENTTPQGSITTHHIVVRRVHHDHLAGHTAFIRAFFTTHEFEQRMGS
jgi:ABC-type transport system involved in cytochrome c biogenesis ATPase subunit